MRHPSSFVVAFFGLLALWPVLTGSYGMDLIAKIMIYALLALSLELLVGSTGLAKTHQAGAAHQQLEAQGEQGVDHDLGDQVHAVGACEHRPQGEQAKEGHNK